MELIMGLPKSTKNLVKTRKCNVKIIKCTRHSKLKTFAILKWVALNKN